MELGDPQLRPFWAKAEELGALVYIHPGGNRDRRFKRFHLWNSVGQAFEEAMAISSLMYDGVLEVLPQAQDLHLPWRRLHAVLHGPHRSQLRGKGQHPRQHDASRRSSICACSISIPASTSGPVLQHLVDKVGADRVLLGSDYPVGETKPIEFVRETETLSSAQKEQIVRANAAALFGLANIGRHSGACLKARARIHNPGLWVWIPALAS